MPNGADRARGTLQPGEVESLGDHLGATERNSIEAERESKTKLIEFYDRQLEKDEKQHFQAIITDVKNHGLYIELTDSLAFGMVHISTLDNDYHPNSEGTALVGRRKKQSYALGHTSWSKWSASTFQTTN